jgi:hypothetical protein
MQPEEQDYLDKGGYSGQHRAPVNKSDKRPRQRMPRPFILRASAHISA